MGPWKNIALVAFSFCTIFSIAMAEEIRYDSDGRRDPFAPALSRTGSGSESNGFLIEGIVFDPRGGSYALINGQIYREGESLDGSQLVKIMPDRLILLQNSEEVVMWLREEILTEQEKEQPIGNETG